GIPFVGEPAPVPGLCGGGIDGRRLERTDLVLVEDAAAAHRPVADDEVAPVAADGEALEEVRDVEKGEGGRRQDERRDRAEAIELRLEEAIGKRLGQLEDVPVALPDLGAGRHIDECAGWLIRGRHSARGYFRQGTLYGFLAHGPLQACPKYRRCRGACFAALAIFQTALPQRTFRVVASCVARNVRQRSRSLHPCADGFDCC